MSNKRLLPLVVIEVEKKTQETIRVGAEIEVGAKTQVEAEVETWARLDIKVQEKAWKVEKKEPLLSFEALEKLPTSLLSKDREFL